MFYLELTGMLILTVAAFLFAGYALNRVLFPDMWD